MTLSWKKRIAGIGLFLIFLSLGPAGAAENDEKVLPSGVGVLQIRDQAVALAFSVAPGGPLFALAPIAGSLGLALEVGPLGERHTLTYPDKKIVIGPGSTTWIVTDPDGSRPRFEGLRQTPVKFGVDQLRVPLDFLEKAIGEELGYQLSWDAESLVLRLDKRELRQLEASVTVVHQYRVSTVEVRFSDVPRYRTEKSADAVTIQLIGDRLVIPEPAPVRSPLVSGVDAADNTLRIRLAEGASAAEPRLLVTPVPRLIIEVFEQTEAAFEPGADPRRSSTDSRSRGLRTIVLDPGHGGAETGAIGSQGTTEKDLNLLIARSLKRTLERRLPVSVVLTRDSDVELPLESRPAIANQNKADLFISLHFNASFGKRAHGAETYFLSREASDQLAALAAETENQYGASNGPEADLKLILWDLAQSYHLSSSQRFATLVQEELNLALGLRDRGVKQAPFKVLMGAEMPAVLVELGFLSNPEEETKLQSPAYHNELVNALVRAVVRFKTQLEANARAR